MTQKQARKSKQPRKRRTEPYRYCHPSFRRGKATRKKIHPTFKKSSEQVFLNNFRSVPDSCHREGGKSAREPSEKIRVNTVFFSEDFSRASTRKICPKRGPRKSHEKVTSKNVTSNEKPFEFWYFGILGGLLGNHPSC